uniref:DNA-directed DNA polymerase n=1 Tax=Strongyloides papillosus TaxID=174720 RepID=A0A0N5C450_STREA
MDSIPYNESFENSDAYYGYSMDCRRNKSNALEKYEKLIKNNDFEGAKELFIEKINELHKLRMTNESQAYDIAYLRNKVRGIKQVITVLPVETNEFMETEYFDNTDKEPEPKRVKIESFCSELRTFIHEKGYSDIITQGTLHYLAQHFGTILSARVTKLNLDECLSLQFLCGLSRDKFFKLKEFIEKAIGIEIFPPTIVLNKLCFEIGDDSDIEYFNFITIKNNNQYIFVDTINDTDRSQSHEIIGCYNTIIADDLTLRYEHLVYNNKINTNQRVVDICITGDNCNDTTKICAYFKLDNVTSTYSNLLPLAIFKGIYTKETLRKVASLIANQINNLKDLTVKPSKDHDKYTVKIRWFMIGDFKFVHYVMGSKVNFNKHPCPYCTNFKGKPLWEDYETTANVKFENQNCNENTIFTVIPIQRILIPLLHLFMGMFTDIFNKLKINIKKSVSKLFLKKILDEGFNNIDKHIGLYWKTLDGEEIIHTLQAFQRIFSNIPLGELTKQNIDDYEWIISSIYNIQSLCLADDLSDSQHKELDRQVSILRTYYTYNIITDDLRETAKCHVLVEHFDEFKNIYQSANFFGEQCMSSGIGWTLYNSNFFHWITYNPSQQCRRMFYLMKAANNCHDKGLWK